MIFLMQIHSMKSAAPVYIYHFGYRQRWLITHFIYNRIISEISLLIKAKKKVEHNHILGKIMFCYINLIEVIKFTTYSNYIYWIHSTTVQYCTYSKLKFIIFTIQLRINFLASLYYSTIKI